MHEGLRVCAGSVALHCALGVASDAAFRDPLIHGNVGRREVTRPRPRVHLNGL